MDHSDIWSSVLVGGSIAGVAVLSVILHLVPMYILPLFFRPGAVGLEWDVMLGLQFNIDKGLYGGIASLCALVSFASSLITLVKLRTLAKGGQLRETNNQRDVSLLLHCVFMVVVQLFVTLPALLDLPEMFMRVINPNQPSDWFAFWKRSDVIVFFTVYLTPTRLAEIQCLSATPFLLLISKHTRVAYWRFYFTCSRSARTEEIPVVHSSHMTSDSGSSSKATSMTAVNITGAESRL
ncbi:hypothetical protein AAVH_24405 [Aphelenchoides avenae]|nr:hypothetical protein AAVH_24405 [Aphelenchus avenae]